MKETNKLPPVPDYAKPSEPIQSEQPEGEDKFPVRDSHTILHLHSLDMADFYLEIYASRDTFSRAKIMEMFRDYHNVKLSNIKKEQICYKTNKPCKYDCQGLCKESV